MKYLYKQLLLTLFLVLFTITNFAQNYSYDWAHVYGSTNFEQAYTVTSDSDGNVYTSGTFREITDFDPSLAEHIVTSAGQDDIFILKLDSDGNFLWVVNFGSLANDQALSHAMDTDGNIVVTGIYAFTVDFDPGPGTVNKSSAGSSDFFVLKLNPDGDFMWVETFGGIGFDYSNDIFLDASNYIYLTGEFKETVDFDNGVGVSSRTSNGSSDIYVLKLSPAGEFEWVRAVGGSQFDRGLSLTVDNEGNVISTGQFKGSFDFNPGIGTDILTSLGDFDNYVQKLNSDGDYLWTRIHGNSGIDHAYAVTTDASGNIYNTGGFTGAVDFDPGPSAVILTSSGAQDYYVWKLDPSGNYMWVNGLGEGVHDVGRSILVDSNESLIITGSFGGSADFDAGGGTHILTSAGSKDIFIQKLTLDGDFIWAERIGGPNEDLGHAIHLNEHILLVAGGSSATVDFDFGPGVAASTSTGFSDCFTLQLFADSINVFDTIVSCTDFVWIDGITYTESNSELEFTTGTETIFTNYLDLTIDPTFTYTSTDEINACNEYTWIDGITYFENTDEPTLTLTSIYGCDSTINLDLTIHTSDTIVETISECNWYTWPSSGIIYTESTMDTVNFITETGCDSILILDLTINYNTDSTLIIEACNSYYWETTDETYTENTITTQSLTNVLGCDSLVTLNLTIHYSDTTTETTEACNSYYWEPTDETYTENTEASVLLTNEFGCDSIINLNLTIINNDLTITRDSLTLTASITGAEYQWIDCDNDFLPILDSIGQSLTAVENGNYAVIISKDGCTDTSGCFNINDVGLSEDILANQIQVFPNPTSRELTVIIGEISAPFQLYLYNSLGQEIQRFEINDSSPIKINIEGGSGIYLLKVSTAKASTYLRIVKT